MKLVRPKESTRPRERHHCKMCGTQVNRLFSSIMFENKFPGRVWIHFLLGGSVRSTATCVSQTFAANSYIWVSVVQFCVELRRAQVSSVVFFLLYYIGFMISDTGSFVIFFGPRLIGWHQLEFFFMFGRSYSFFFQGEMAHQMDA